MRANEIWSSSARSIIFFAPRLVNLGLLGFNVRVIGMNGMAEYGMAQHNQKRSFKNVYHVNQLPKIYYCYYLT